MADKKCLFAIFFLIFCFCLLSNKVFALEKIDINTASLKQLETLSGIGPVKAQAIIDARPFSSIDDLLKVKGIGEKTLQKIKDQGLAYVENQSIEEQAQKTSSNSQLSLPIIQEDKQKTSDKISNEANKENNPINPIKNNSLQEENKELEANSLVKADISENTKNISEAVFENNKSKNYAYLIALGLSILSAILILALEKALS